MFQGARIWPTRAPARKPATDGGGRSAEAPRRGRPRGRGALTRIRSVQALSEVYAIPQEHLDFCATIAEIAREKIAPRSAEIDERAEYPWDVRRLLAEQDVLVPPFGTGYGGTGTATLMRTMAVEESGAVHAF